eukprot:m.72039 g.72039  ORF g.72039 m.72039 type:complete len:319 (+) comp12322_c1_seq3:561-1517(+)
MFSASISFCGSTAQRLLVLAVTVLYVISIRTHTAHAVSTSGAKQDMLPSCDSTQGNYKAGKLYNVLGVDKRATQKEIKKAFKKMSIKCHPDKDKSPNANDNFIAIAGAYETLGDESARRDYDAQMDSPFSSSHGSGSGHKTGHKTGHGAGYNGAGSGFHFKTDFTGQGWKPKDFSDINVDDILRGFFGKNDRAGHKHHAGHKDDPFGFEAMFEGLFSGFGSSNTNKFSGARGMHQFGGGRDIRTQQGRDSGATGGFDRLFDSLGSLNGLFGESTQRSARRSSSSRSRSSGTSSSSSSRSRSSSSSNSSSSSSSRSGSC